MQEEEEEESIDHQEVLREKCGELSKCTNLKEKLDQCSERVSSRSNTTETCTEELFDFVHCIDHCVSWGTFSEIGEILLWCVCVCVFTGGKKFVQETKIADLHLAMNVGSLYRH